MLDKNFFAPKSLAVIGASNNPNKLGYVLLKNILDSSQKVKVYAVNPAEREILSLPSYHRVTDIPEKVDMALLAAPSQAALAILDDCGQKGIKRIVMINAGFKEIGKQGSELEKEVLKLARKYEMRVLGPNCLGFADTSLPINATFTPGLPARGNIALVSQSGAMRQSFWDWARESGAGLSKFISLGNEADITEADIIETLIDDDQTKVVIAYVEGISNGARFMEVAAALTRVKPLLIIKSGNTPAGSKAMVSHTGSMAGANEIYDAAFKQSGVIRAESPEQLFDFAFGFAWQPLLAGTRLAILTNSGGPGVMASDAVERAGFSLSSFTEATTNTMLRSRLASFASLSNPIDLTGSVTPDNYEAVLQIVLADPNVDGALVIFSPPGPVAVSQTAASIAKGAQGAGKPVFVNCMGVENKKEELASLTANNIPDYASPERAIDGFKAMNQYRQWRQRKIEAPETIPHDRDAAQAVLSKARQSGVDILSGADAMSILEAYGLKPVKSGLAGSAGEAVGFAAEIGYPVVMKIVSPDVIHKTEFGGVRVDLNTAEAVRNAYAEIVANIGRRESQRHG